MLELLAAGVLDDCCPPCDELAGATLSDETAGTDDSAGGSLETSALELSLPPLQATKPIAKTVVSKAKNFVFFIMK